MRRLAMVFRNLMPVLACTGLLISAPVCADLEPRVPYVPTPLDVVERMLEMAKVNSRDYLIDLGSGDGRLVVTAAKKFGARGFGVDINPVRISEANDNARRNGVSDKVAFYQRDLFQTDLSQATVITMYLLPRVNMELRPKLLELKPGTRLVSHDFDLGDWKADQHVRMAAGDKYGGAGGDSDVYFWVVPAKVAGGWRSQLSVAGKPQSYEFSFGQKYQVIEGTARVNGRAVKLQNARLRGAELSFSLIAEVNGMQVKHDFSGRVEGRRIIGEASFSGSKVAARIEWIAEQMEATAALTTMPTAAGVMY